MKIFIPSVAPAGAFLSPWPLPPGCAASRLARGYLLTAAPRLRVNLGGVLGYQNRMILALPGHPVLVLDLDLVLDLVLAHVAEKVGTCAEIGDQARRVP